MGLNILAAIWPVQPKQNTSLMFRLVLKHLVLVKKYFKSKQAFPVGVCLFLGGHGENGENRESRAAQPRA